MEMDGVSVMGMRFVLGIKEIDSIFPKFDAEISAYQI